MTKTARTGMAILLALSASAAMALADEGNRAVTSTTVTNATGTITQFNYNESGGAAESILVGANVILTFPGTVCQGVGSLGVAGNGVTYSGTSVTFASGFQSVRVTSYTNSTTGAKYDQATPAKPAAYGPTAGTVKSLNYDTEGVVNGFVFLPAGATANIFVDLGGPASATLQPLLLVGATVSVTGTSEAAPLCAPANTPIEVDAASLTFGTTVINLHAGHDHRD